MSGDNIYRRVTILILSMIIKLENKNHKIPVSPVADMYKYAKYYRLDGIIKQCLLTGNFGDFEQMKKYIKDLVWKVELTKWKGTCIMYKSLSCYVHSVSKIQMHAWWYFAKDAPHLTKNISCVMSLLMGGQPSGMQRNLSRSKCALCESHSADTPHHVLFICEALGWIRDVKWENVCEKMPNALLHDIRCMSPSDKTEMLLSCFGGTYTSEWQDMYAEVVKFIYYMYKARCNAYDNLPLNEDRP